MRRNPSLFSRRALPAVPSVAHGGQGPPAKRKPGGKDRRICFVSGTRAEFGLMRSVLHAIQRTPGLRLQLLLTGMHLDRSRGRSLDVIRREGWKINRIVPWPSGKNSPTDTAQATGRAIAAMASAYAELKPDIVLVAGDRVEAFAAAAAAHIAGIVVAHVHGGDRALGQVDDSLRHAITKLSHLHFPATRQSAERIKRLGEDHWRIVRTGAPGLDGMVTMAATKAQVAEAFPAVRGALFALLVLHPESTNSTAELRAARMVLRAAERVFGLVVVVYPNNDPGSAGIVEEWDYQSTRMKNPYFCRDLPRPLFLGLLRDTTVLVGNSSAGIIEAASFGTPVLNLGSRQLGRECSGNVQHYPMSAAKIEAALQRVLNNCSPARWHGVNVYGRGGAGRRIAAVLLDADLEKLGQKLIAY